MEIQKARYDHKKYGRNRRLKRGLYGFIILLLLGSSASYSYLAISKPVPILAAQVTPMVMSAENVVTDIAWPATGQAAFGVSGEGVLAASANETVSPMASITKVITALVILEKSPIDLGQVGVARQFDAVDEEYYRSYLSRYGSVVPSNTGQSVTDLQALEAMMVVSANNIADSLVRWHFGSMDAYLIYANELLDKWGMQKTSVADASGFSPSSVSTPSELVLLGERLLDNPVLTEIVNTREIQWPGWGLIKNTNQLLADQQAIGIKTGNTDEAGRCLLFAYRFGPSNDKIFIGAVMGQPSYQGIFTSAKSLKESAMPHFRNIEIAPAGTKVAEISSSWDKKSSVVTSESLQIYGWVGKSYDLDIDMNIDSTNILENQIVGTASSKGKSVKLMADSAIEEPSFIWRLANYIE